MRRIVLILAVAAVSAGVTAAAIVLPAGAGGGGGGGGGNDGTQGIAQGDRPDRAGLLGLREELRQCMQERGFTLGPNVEIEVEGGSVTLNGRAVDAERFMNAISECREQVGVPSGVPRDGFWDDDGPRLGGRDGDCPEERNREAPEQQQSSFDI
jgi:hypothetical protein